MTDSPTAAILDGLVRPAAMPTRLRQLARAGAADGALIVRSRGPHTLSIVASPEIHDVIVAYLRGDRPADSRAARVYPSLDEGFRLDHDDFSDREIARDPFYQEFLRPAGFGWNATALLARLDNGDEIHLALKRRYDRGPFLQTNIADLSRQLPLLRDALGIVGVILGDEPHDGVQIWGAGRTVVGFTPRGEAFFISRAVEHESVLSIRGGALIPVHAHERSELASAAARSLASAGPGAVLLHGPDGRRYAFRLRPWPGASESAVPLIGVLSELDPATIPSEDWLGAVRALFHLSASEARVAALVAQGVAIPQIARSLGLSAGTVRNHLKAIFLKTGATRQVDLALLLSRI